MRSSWRRAGKIKLAAEIALASSAQVAVFLVPAVCLLALLIDPITLAFREIELVALGDLRRRRRRRYSRTAARAGSRASILIALYVGIAAAFWVAGDRV